MSTAKKIVLAKLFQGEPKLTDFSIVEEKLPPIQDGEILCESLWLSVDPYMRKCGVDVPGETLHGAVVARITESRAPSFPKDRYMVGYFGWRTKTIYNTKEGHNAYYPKPYLLPEFGDLSLSLGIGALGMPGVTANLAFIEVCKPKSGETVVVSAAAGAVGSLVGQIAKMKGCRVIGFTGSDEKVRVLTEKLGFNAAYNYKKTKLSTIRNEAAPKGVDCFFDTVGGEFSNEVMRNMNRKGRVAVCGAISGINVGVENVVVPMVQPLILLKELTVEGFIVWNYGDRWMQTIQQNLQWIKEKKLIFLETVTEGFENAPKAFIGMLRGENVGKAVVKIL